MISFRLGSEDLANLRFAVSPLMELWQSVRALQHPSSRAVHMPWLDAAWDRLEDVEMATLFALQPARGLNPDYLHPPPTAPLSDLEDDLARMLETPAAQIRTETMSAYAATGVPSVLRLFVERPDTVMAGLADLARKYWERALAPHWPRLRALLEGDVLYRARQAADGGAHALFADIAPAVRYLDSEVLIDLPCDQSVELQGQGMLFIPSAFIWPAVAVIMQEPWQPTIIYPARGTAALWEPSEPAANALGALLGSRRACVLAALDSPRSTTELARQLDVPAASISQHLSVLRAAGLVTRSRVGRLVLYDRAQLGEQLVRSTADDIAA